MNTQSSTQTRLRLAQVILAVLAGAGLISYVYQMMNGLGVTGMNNITSWGSYIALFMFFVGLSAGGLIVASSASVFHITEFKSLAKPAILLSTVCICLAALFILVDLGGIQRVWHMLVSPTLTSPLVWDMTVISCYLALNLLYLYCYTRPTVCPKKVARISYVALPVAILVHSVTAWIFSLQIGRGWYSSIMAPLFVSSALDSGLALLLIVLVALRAAHLFELSQAVLAKLAKLLAVFVAVDGAMIFCELITMAYPGGETGAYLHRLLTGEVAPFIWFELIMGLAIPFILLVNRGWRLNTPVLLVASTLIVLGVLCKRIWLLFAAFAVPNVSAAPGVTVGNARLVGKTAYQMLGSYHPSLVELCLSLGLCALGALVFLCGIRRLLNAQAKKQG